MLCELGGFKHQLGSRSIGFELKRTTTPIPVFPIFCRLLLRIASSVLRMVSDKSQLRNLIRIEHACFVIGLFCLPIKRMVGNCGLPFRHPFQSGIIILGEKEPVKVQVIFNTDTATNRY